ncbi:MAG: hypothetical protein ISR90_06345 [Candidatus Marinimicrobia bacterium]|nr:hypothetical protein [Candidatus Neomarinimicrobiota bacterium]MBL7023650.1 hypothetical protein [Candidatus Neomarinimicrobiota bacterium]MBL7109802.1 hypothetical protein [Candidatus Neomarinimicrobiota bacterium]
MFSFSIDQGLVCLYLLGTLSLGLFKRSKTDVNSYLFAGRKLTVPAFVATLVATWYGGILEVGRFSFENGIVVWVIFGLFYYIAALIFIKFIVPKIISKHIRTIPEFIQNTYGRNSALIATVFVILLVSPAPYIKMLATLLRHLWEMPELLALVIGSVFSMIYAFSGGFSSVIRTDKLQFFLMFSGFALILGTAISKYGGISFLLENAPDYAFEIPGNFSWTFIFVWGFIAMITFIDPGFYQRCFAGNSVQTVKKGIFISIIFWFIFDMMSIFTGIYASAILPSNILGNPYLELADFVLSPISRGFFMVSLLAIVMSTVDSFTFISAYTLGKDLPSAIKGNFSDLDSFTTRNTRFGLLATAIISIIIALWFPNAIDIWYTVGTLAIPVLLIPIISAMYGKPLKYPAFSMIISLTISSIWFIFGMLNKQNCWPVYPLGIEPLYPGLLTGIIIYFSSYYLKSTSRK